MNLEQLHALVEIAFSGVPASENTRTQLVHFKLIQADAPELTERGQVFLGHVLALPLPEPVSAWRMPGASVTVASAPMPETEEGVAPPPPPPPTRLTRRQIPTDPVELRAEALRMLDSGCGMNETAELLKLSPDQVQAIFYGGS